ncbi:MAG: hypothetical protein HY915_02125 [Desulfovibrio sp.]|nr:hypothetical protein [Desulfovibrio sp.]
MPTIRPRLAVPLLALVLCLSTPLVALSANSGVGPTPFDSSKADNKKANENKAKFDAMNKGADLMLDGSDMMMKKDKQSMADGQKMMSKGDRMMRSSGAKDKGSLKMLSGAEMMLKAAELMVGSPDSKEAEKMMADGKFALLQGKSMMMDTLK